MLEFVEEMRIAESNSEQFGVTRLSLMEKAGTAVAEAAKKVKQRPGTVVVVCGSGNNGGDGLVAARHLLQDGYRVTVFLTSESSGIRTGEARANFEAFKKTGGEHFDTSNGDFLRRLVEGLRRADLIIDAIFGTGIAGKITGLPAEAISLMIESGKKIIAVDTPSGLDPFSGQVAEIAVKADLTVTFHGQKKGLAERAEYTGVVEVVDIGIPINANLFVTEEDLRALLKPRPRFSHKGDYGTVLVIGGSDLYSGAPALAGLAALRTGTGLAFIGAPEAVAPSIRATSPDLIVRPLPGGSVKPEHLDLLKEQFERATVVAIGPGLGRDELSLETAKMIFELSMRSDKPIVLDADAIGVINSVKSSRSDRAVITPHAGEFKRITGTETKEHWRDRLQVVNEYSSKKNCTILLKGHHTVLSDGKRTRVYRGGNPGMAKGGMGDVLTGVISGLISQNLGVFDSACLGAYITGEAANRLFKTMGFHFLASDLLSAIPEVMREYDRVSEE